MNKQTIIIVIVILLFVFMNSKAKADTKNEEEPTKEVEEKIVYITNDKGEEKPVKTKINFNRLLKKGVNGKEVKGLQMLINYFLDAQNKPLLKADGQFGNLTENALYSLIGKKQIKLSDLTPKTPQNIIDKLLNL